MRAGLPDAYPAVMQLARRQIIAYVALGAVVLAVGARYLIGADEAAPDGQAVVLQPVSAPSAPPAASAPAEAVVYVCGAVRSPGVVRLPADARVADAIELAGGAQGTADLAAVNLAAKVADGQQIVVPERGQQAQSAGAVSGDMPASAAAGALVNLNTASLEELDTLEGVGPATAQKIIDYRLANGGFSSIDEIKNVSGIGDARFAAIKDSITV
jgi:competence protein ComEA